MLINLKCVNIPAQKKRHIHILVQSEKIWADSIFCVGSARIFFDSIVRWKIFFLSIHCLSVRYHVFIRALRKVTEHHFFSTHLIFLIFGFYTHFVLLRCLWQNRRWRKNFFFCLHNNYVRWNTSHFLKIIFFFCSKSSLNELLINLE